MEYYGFSGVIFTGHGITGALANIAAFTYENANDEQDYPLLLFTFGQPKVGDSVLQKLIILK